MAVSVTISRGGARLDCWRRFQEWIDDHSSSTWALSSRTMFEAIDADPDSVVIDSEGRFEAVASVYVTLVYGPSRDEETMSDEYVATVGGTLNDEGAAIESVVVDTSPFYD